jgi:hypothetical protein
LSPTAHTRLRPLTLSLEAINTSPSPTASAQLIALSAATYVFQDVPGDGDNATLAEDCALCRASQAISSSSARVPVRR